MKLQVRFGIQSLHIKTHLMVQKVDFLKTILGLMLMLSNAPLNLVLLGPGDQHESLLNTINRRYVKRLTSQTDMRPKL